MTHFLFPSYELVSFVSLIHLEPFLLLEAETFKHSHVKYEESETITACCGLGEQLRVSERRFGSLLFLESGLFSGFRLSEGVCTRDDVMASCSVM